MQIFTAAVVDSEQRYFNPSGKGFADVVAELQQEIGIMRQANAELREQLKEAQADLAERDNEITVLKARVRILEKEEHIQERMERLMSL